MDSLQEESLPAGYRRPSPLLTWVPLLAGLASTYGPVAWNYGMALYFLNYRHGFVKRGLVGEFFLPWDHVTTSGLIAVQVAFILAAFAATYWVLRGLLFGSTEDRMLAAVLLSGPALLPHLGFLFAQPDVTLYLLLIGTLAALLSSGPAGSEGTGTCVATLLCCVALLAHEAFSLAFYPLVVGILWDRCRRREMRWSLAAMQIGTVVFVFGAVMHFGELKVAPAVVMSDAAARTSVPIQPQVFEVMASSFTEQRALVSHFYQGQFLVLVGMTLVVSAPYFWMLGALLRRAGRERAYRRLDGLVLTALFVTPLVLCYLGHDVSRWIAASGIDATLFLCYLALRDDSVRSSLRTWAAGPTAVPWLAYGLIAGPYGASGIRVAEAISRLWRG